LDRAASGVFAVIAASGSFTGPGDDASSGFAAREVASGFVALESEVVVTVESAGAGGTLAAETFATRSKETASSQPFMLLQIAAHMPTSRTCSEAHRGLA
jgi:hypothetical protein